MDVNPTSIGAHRGEVQLRGLRLRLLQALWSLLVICDLFVLMVSLPAFYQVLHTVCTGPIATCFITDQLLPQELTALRQAGISLHTYALAVFCLDLVASLAFLLVGAVIFWRRANTWMGLFVSFLLINFGSLGLSISHANSLPIPPTNSLYALAYGIGLPLSILAYLCFAFFFFTFPNGRFVPRWSWILVSLWIVNFVVFAAPPDSPLNINNWSQLLQACWLLMVFGGSLSTQIYRFRRVAPPVQRQQIKWLIYGFAPVLLLPICFALLQVLFPSLFWQAVTEPLYRFYYLPVPLCIGIAILRYRLWDIDLIINRTLVYGTLTACVIGLYVLVVVGLGTLIQAQGNVLLSLLATGLIAVLFQPLRLRLQRAVNRLMYGERDDPYAVLAHLGNRLEATLVPEKVLPTIVETVAQTLKLPYVAIALLPEQGSFNGAADGTAGAITLPGAQEADIVASYGEPPPNPVRVPLVYQAETVGYLLLAARAGDTFGKADKRLLTDLARQAGVAVYAVRLTTHLQDLTVSLQESRERLVTTREEERRRLRRDLHDGLGPALASLTFKVDAARNLLAQDNERTETLLAEVRQQAQEAISDIRRLVYNLRPPALDEFGLLSALREQVALYQHQGLQIEFETPSSMPPFPAAVEVAIYRIAQEALTNVVRHAQAQHCLLRLSIDTEALHLDISDDGQGIPTVHHIGIGLHAMHERASELGGHCTITPGPSRGTVICVRLPLGAARDVLPTAAQKTEHQQQQRTSASDASLMHQEE
jgi:signal transduction histidine kinase